MRTYMEVNTRNITLNVAGFALSMKLFNPRRAGGRLDAASGLLRMAEKRRRCAAVFWHSFSYILFAPFLKISA